MNDHDHCDPNSDPGYNSDCDSYYDRDCDHSIENRENGTTSDSSEWNLVHTIYSDFNILGPWTVSSANAVAEWV